MFFLSLALLLIATLGMLGGMFAKSRETQTGSKAAIALALPLAVIFLTLSCVSIVDTRHIGIVKSYGKPTGRTTGSGLQWTKPWEGVDDEWDATRQSFDHLGDKCTQPGDGSLWVSISGNRNACVRVQVNWETVSGQQAADNWATYRPRNGKNRFEAFEAYQVNPGINSAVLSTFAAFDPLSLVDKATGEAKAPNLAADYTRPLTDAINANLGKDIKVMSISWGLIGYDTNTTGLISAYAQKILEGRNLAVDQANAKARASVAQGTGVPAAVQQCLDLIKALGKGEPGLCLSGGNVALTRPVS